MFIITAKLHRGRLLAVAAAAVVVCGALVAGHVLTGTGAAVSTAASPKGVKTNEDRVAYLSAYGWQVNDQPLASQELLIPTEMDETYDDYLTLQREQGFDLEEYAGKRVKRYTYEITNYPSGEQGVQANLILYKNTVIGGEVLSPQLDGFLHGLSMP